MKGYWWKFLAVLLLLYVVLVGLRTPLSPALVGRTPDRIAGGDVKVEVWGYNTDFFQGFSGFWIRNDSQWVCGHAHRVVAEDHAELHFNVPRGMRAELSDLVLRTTAHGDLVYPGAFYTEDRGKGIPDMIAAGCPAPSHDGTFTATDAGRFSFPDRNILNESIRNLFFHVPMWFTMIALMAIGVWHSIKGLRTNDLQHDTAAIAAVRVGLVFGLLGLASGSLWARTTWGAWWTNDVKLNGAAVGVLIYLAYLVLRGSVNEPAKRARLAGIYSIFAFTFMLLFFFVLPRLSAVDSLHPGNGGNPAFTTYDLDNHLRVVFWPACLGWILLGVWMYDLNLRLARIKQRFADAEPA